MPGVVKPGGTPSSLNTIFWSIASRFAGATINTRLIAIVLTLAVPLNVVVALMIWRLAGVADEMQRMSLHYAARSIATAVDAQLGTYATLGQVLSHDPALLEDSLEAFDSGLRQKIASIPHAWVVIADLEGRQLLNTREPKGRPLPLRPAEAIAAQKRAFETRSTIVSDVYQGPSGGSWMASANIPIFKNGAPFRSLALMMDVAGFVDFLAFQDMPRSWRAAIRDAHARLIARVPDNDHWAGRLASEPFRATNDRNGLFHLTSPEGEDLLVANKRGDFSGWTISIAVNTAELRAAVLRTIGWAVALGGAISLISLIFAIWIAKRITGPLAELRRKAGALLADPRVRFEPGVPELGELWATLRGVAADRCRAEEHQRLLMQELNHRTKNLLCVVLSIANQTAACSPVEFLERFAERIQALAASQDLLIQSKWRGVEIEALVRAQLAHFADLIDERITIDGPPFSVTPSAAQSIGMAVHELATNAGKYGSLSDDHGSVTIGWRLDGGAFCIEWIERDGPRVTPPKRRGFGTTIISAMAQASVDGEVELDYRQSGVTWRLRCAAGKVMSAGA